MVSSGESFEMNKLIYIIPALMGFGTYFYLALYDKPVPQPVVESRCTVYKFCNATLKNQKDYEESCIYTRECPGQPSVKIVKPKKEVL